MACQPPVKEKGKEVREGGAGAGAGADLSLITPPENKAQKKRALSNSRSDLFII